MLFSCSHTKREREEEGATTRK